METDYVSKLAKPAEINSDRAEPFEKIVKENHTRKIKELTLACELEKKRLNENLSNEVEKFKAIEKKLIEKNKQIAEDTELDKEKDLVKVRLADIKKQESVLKQIREFNQSKNEYKRLIDQTKSDRKDIEKEKEEKKKF